MRPKQKPKIPPLDKKIKPNPKYEGIRPTIDTGNNTRKQVERLEEIRQYYKFRPDEIFRRITVTSLVTLMLEVSKLECQEEDLERLSQQQQEQVEKVDIIEDDDKSETTVVSKTQQEAKEDNLDCEADSLDSALEEEEDDGMIESVVFKGKRIKRGHGMHSHHHSSVGDLLQGLGGLSLAPELVIGHNHQLPTNQFSSSYHHHDSSNAANTFNLDAPPPDPPRQVYHPDQDQEKMMITRPRKDRPYLILDIRDPEDYRRSRMLTSKSFPFARLSRSVNFETKDMLKFKNVDGKLIVVVDADESLSARFATTLIQRGYDNVFVLSGGLRVAGIKFPDHLVGPLTHDLDDEDDLDEQISEEQIMILEEYLEEALTSGTSRLSTYAPTVCSSRVGNGWPSRISSSQSNLPQLISSGGEQFIRHKPRQVPMGIDYYPPKPQRTSFHHKSRRS